MLDRFMQLLFLGLVTGSFLTVATLGFALVSRVEKFLNIAHAEIISMAAFVTYYLQTVRGWNIVIAGATAVLIAAILSVVVSRLFYAPIRRTSSVVLLITSVGVVYILHGVVEFFVPPGVYSLTLPSFGAFDLGLFRVGLIDLVVVAAAVVCTIGLHAFLTRTKSGVALGAISDDADLAAARGIDLNRSSIYLWLIAGGLAGVAGVLLGLRGALTTDIAFGQILLILSVSIVAGLGNIFGVVVAALLLGIAMDVSTLFVPAGYREAVAFTIIILALIFRPEGLSGFSLRRREA